MKLGIEFPRKLSLAYESMCKPLCHELKLPQTAFDILMFLANNPEFKTARDIVEVRKLKANLVSVNIDKLVNEGYLVRKNVEGDRRKVQLLCTDKAQPIISRGQQLQEHFVEQLFADIDDTTRQTIFQGMDGDDGFGGGTVGHARRCLSVAGRNLYLCQSFDGAVRPAVHEILHEQRDRKRWFVCHLGFSAQSDAAGTGNQQHFS